MCLVSCQTSKLGFFEKTFNGLNPITIFAKSAILDVWQHPKDTSENVALSLTISITVSFLSLHRWIWGWRLEVFLIAVWSQCQKIVREKLRVSYTTSFDIRVMKWNFFGFFFYSRQLIQTNFKNFVIDSI